MIHNLNQLSLVTYCLPFVFVPVGSSSDIKRVTQGLPQGLVAKTMTPGAGFPGPNSPGQGIGSPYAAAKSSHATTKAPSMAQQRSKILCVPTKTQPSQINKYKKPRFKIKLFLNYSKPREGESM